MSISCCLLDIVQSFTFNDEDFEYGGSAELPKDAINRSLNPQFFEFRCLNLHEKINK